MIFLKATAYAIKKFAKNDPGSRKLMYMTLNHHSFFDLSINF